MNTTNTQKLKQKYLVIDIDERSIIVCSDMDEVKEELKKIADDFCVKKGKLEGIYVFDITNKKEVSINIETIVAIDYN